MLAWILGNKKKDGIILSSFAITTREKMETLDLLSTVSKPEILQLIAFVYSQLDTSVTQRTEVALSE